MSWRNPQSKALFVMTVMLVQQTEYLAMHCIITIDCCTYTAGGTVADTLPNVIESYHVQYAASASAAREQSGSPIALQSHRCQPFKTSHARTS